MTRPAVFADLGFEAALERSVQQGKLLLVDATAAWCGPCRMMDRVTWSAPEVAAALAEVIAIQVDVDAQRAVAARLAIQAMPTVIAFKDGKEVDRVVGAQKADQLLGWLAALARGETAVDAMRAEAAAQPDKIIGRIRLAHMLAMSRRFEEATAEYLSVWQQLGGNGAYLGVPLRRLFRAHPPARAAFARRRDELAPPTDRAPDPAMLTEWVALNNLLGESRRVLGWFDATSHADPSMVESMIGPLLIGANRWAEVWKIYGARLFDWPLRDLARTWRVARRRLGR